jgi:CDP-glucose 4,6-dehydratase
MGAVCDQRGGALSEPSGHDPFWKGRPVLVTGAQGFIGSWLAEALLDRGAEVVAVVRDQPALSRFALEDLSKRCTLVWADLSDAAELLRAVNEYSADVVFHLAAQTIVETANRSPLSTFETNVRGTYNMLEACRLAGSVGRIVVASSDKAYGQHELLPYSESAPLVPTFPYDVSKACADTIARSYFTTYGLPVAVTRLANVYGGGDVNFSRIVPDTVRALLQGRAPVIRSDGTPQRDFMYIEDAVSAYLAIAGSLDSEDVRGKAFNAGTGDPAPVREVVERLIAISGLRVEPDVTGSGTPAGEIDRQYLDSTRIREAVGWSARWSLDDGLRATYEWYERNLGREPAIQAL